MNASTSSQLANPEDAIVWADGTWCYRGNLPEYTHMSDDYEQITAETDRWHDVVGTTPMDLALARGYGYLALLCSDERRPLQVLKSAAGFYLGTLDEDGLPCSRETTQFWATSEGAAEAMRTANWTQRATP